MSVSIQKVQGRQKSLGFARVAAATFWTKPMGVSENLEKHWEMAQCVDDEHIQLMAFPELGLSGYGCRNAFRERALQIASLEALQEFCGLTKTSTATFVLGLPLALNRLFNVAAVVNQGRVIAFIPKSFLAARSEWQEDEWFSPASELQTNQVKLPWQDEPVPIGTDILISVCGKDAEEQFIMGVEICEDGWQANSPGDRHAHNGATVIVNLSASNWVLGKDQWRLIQFPANSGRQKSAYIYVTMAGDSTSSVVWDGQCFIAEDGNILAQTTRWKKPRESELITTDVDIQKLHHDREMDGGWGEATRLNQHPYRQVQANVRSWEVDNLRRPLPRLPFVPKDPNVMRKVGEELFNALAQGVIGRLWHVGKGQPFDAYMGLSGGLDSALAFLVSVYAYDQMGWNRKHLHAVRLPGPASGKRTQDNSLKLAKALGTGIHTANITRLATQALRDAGHEPCWQCLQCENAQARARTYILKTMGFNLGTGDMSEAAKGWCTEGGDQSSHFHVIANIPKTLVRYLVRYYIEHLAGDVKTKKTLESILNTLISPELVKVEPGQQIQSSEDKVGPYELTDFFMNHMLRTGADPARIAFLAKIAFSRKESEGDIVYDSATILKWLRDFYVQFGRAQFKRNASPDFVLVATLGLGAHDKWRWPSDGSMQIWTDEVELLQEIEKNSD
ncbi:NAD(+) synthase [Candidatus Uhrbacteria bacterium]|nr:NAD(+) synthase [Candidatus Uhrbacteria bacterium]